MTNSIGNCETCLSRKIIFSHRLTWLHEEAYKGSIFWGKRCVGAWRFKLPFHNFCPEKFTLPDYKSTIHVILRLIRLNLPISDILLCTDMLRRTRKLRRSCGWSWQELAPTCSQGNQTLVVLWSWAEMRKKNLWEGKKIKSKLIQALTHFSFSRVPNRKFQVLYSCKFCLLQKIAQKKNPSKENQYRIKKKMWSKKIFERDRFASEKKKSAKLLWHLLLKFHFLSDSRKEKSRKIKTFQSDFSNPLSQDVFFFPSPKCSRHKELRRRCESFDLNCVIQHFAIYICFQLPARDIFW